MSENKNRSGFWYLLPILFGVIGGIVINTVALVAYTIVSTSI